MVDNNKVLGKGHMVAGLAGMVCPVVGVGEALVSVLMYPLFKQSNMVGDSKVANLVTSLTMSSLMRYSFYEPFYNPVMDVVSNYFS